MRASLHCEGSRALILSRPREAGRPSKDEGGLPRPTPPCDPRRVGRSERCGFRPARIRRRDRRIQQRVERGVVADLSEAGPHRLDAGIVVSFLDGGWRGPFEDLDDRAVLRAQDYGMAIGGEAFGAQQMHVVANLGEQDVLLSRLRAVGDDDNPCDWSCDWSGNAHSGFSPSMERKPSARSASMRGSMTRVV